MPDESATRMEELLWDELQSDSAWYHAHRSVLMGKYGGQFVAVSRQTVLAHKESMAELRDAVRQLQHDPARTVVEYVPRPGESLQMIRSFRR